MTVNSRSSRLLVPIAVTIYVYQWMVKDWPSSQDQQQQQKQKRVQFIRNIVSYHVYDRRKEKRASFSSSFFYYLWYSYRFFFAFTAFIHIPYSFSFYSFILLRLLMGTFHRAVVYSHLGWRWPPLMPAKKVSVITPKRAVPCTTVCRV